ncbi:MAG: hypothetical protein HUJ72_09115 [Blautia sp.]|nr:hypothetical protein [Blautia sp.]
MKEYLEQIMHQSIDERKYEDLGKLPLGCRNVFELKILKLGSQEFLLAAPIEDMGLTELRKMRLQMERYTGYLCAFYLKKVNWYAAPKMVEEGIPFVWENHQVYLPFAGMLLQENAGRPPKNCTVISFLTQKLLLKALYENWKDVSAVQAAELLHVSRMSVTRCYDEIEALGLPFLKTQRRSRRFYAMDDKKEMWETMLPFLRNPVIRTFRPERRPDTDMILSGTTALAEYSMFGEDHYPTYAVRKDQIGELGIKGIREVPANEEPACVIQEVGYLLTFGKRNAVDPLSLTLMLTEQELDDPRVESCKNKMLEELVW